MDNPNSEIASLRAKKLIYNENLTGHNALKY